MTLSGFERLPDAEVHPESESFGCAVRGIRLADAHGARVGLLSDEPCALVVQAEVIHRGRVFESNQSRSRSEIDAFRAALEMNLV